jgi:hypothetical protein
MLPSYWATRLTALALAVIPLTASFADETWSSGAQDPSRYSFGETYSRLPLEQAMHIGAVLIIVREAGALRVSTLQWLSTSGKKGSSFEEYSKRIPQLLRDLDLLKLPMWGSAVVSDLKTVLNAQLDFFKKWNQALTDGEKRSFAPEEGNPPHPSVRAAHQALESAYRRVKAQMSNENERNLRGVYNDFSKLDFVDLNP